MPVGRSTIDEQKIFVLSMQTTSHLLMIRPVNFGYNAETAVNNAFQTAGDDERTQEKALAEFEGFVRLLRDNGVDVTIFDDNPLPHTPDSIFPNNWVSFHGNGTVCLYPLFAENRRAERKESILYEIGKKFKVTRTMDFSHYEKEGLYLEGTGSMVFDRDNKMAYACLSPRTDKKILKFFCDRMGYRQLTFKAVDAHDKPIYHTNVMMCVADKYVVLCLDALPQVEEKDWIITTIERSGKEPFLISLDQMNHFAGNMLQVHNAKKEKLLIMSSQAYASLEPGQIDTLRGYNRILHSPLTTIETYGGGSARCMMAEIHLPVQPA
jgi:hypothetical protein